MPVLIREDVNHCATLTLNRPDVRNAINSDIVSAFETQLDLIEQDNTRAVVITGNGRGFCAGTDLKEMMELGTEGYLKRVERMHQLFLRLRDFKCPTIAAIHGPALGGGTELAAACTFRIAATDALFGLPEIRLGVMPCYGGTQSVSRLIGESQALDLMLTGRMINASQALEMKLVNRVADSSENIVDAALAFAAELMPYSLVAQQAIRRSVAASFDHSFEQGMALEREQARIAFSSDDAKEGVMAFLEKREAIFNDR